MSSIQSIICYNGGSAGDLVKKLSLLCYDIDIGQVCTSGLVQLPTYYFADFFIDSWKEPVDLSKIDWSRVAPVENCHYYSNDFLKISKRLFFIDYDDSVNSVILSEYIRKRKNNSISKFLKAHIHTLPAELQHMVNETNCLRVFETQWLKNLRSWRSNSNLTAINFFDILKKSTMINMVETITESNVKDMQKFDSIYNQWLSVNSTFVNLTR